MKILNAIICFNNLCDGEQKVMNYAEIKSCNQCGVKPFDCSKVDYSNIDSNFLEEGKSNDIPPLRITCCIITR